MPTKPTKKPMVLGWLNPLANGWLTIRQDKTRQDKVGFGSSNQNQNPPYSLVSQPIEKGFLSWSFFLRAHPKRAKPKARSTVFNRLSTGFQQSPEGRVFAVLDYRNNVEAKACPICGESRPLDWFGPELKFVEYKKDGTVRRTIRYRKYLACWKCRAVRRIKTLSRIPFSDEMGR